MSPPPVMRRLRRRDRVDGGCQRTPVPYPVGTSQPESERWRPATTGPVSSVHATLPQALWAAPGRRDPAQPARTRHRPWRPGAWRVRGRPRPLRRLQGPQELRGNRPDHQCVWQAPDRAGPLRAQPAPDRPAGLVGVLLVDLLTRRSCLLRPSPSTRGYPSAGPPCPGQPMGRHPARLPPPPSLLRRAHRLAASIPRARRLTSPTVGCLRIWRLVLGLGCNLVGCCRELADLDQLPAQRLDPLQQAVERRLVLDRAVQHRRHRLHGGRHALERGQQGVAQRPWMRIS